MKDLDKFKNEMNLSGQNVYVGHRYVPKIFGEWDNTKIYEPLSIVQYQGASYTSRQPVPIGVDINNEEFWVVTGNYNAQVEQYRQDVRKLESDVTNLNDNIIEVETGYKNADATLKTEIQNDYQQADTALKAEIENDYEQADKDLKAEIEINLADFGAVGDAKIFNSKTGLHYQNGQYINKIGNIYHADYYWNPDDNSYYESLEFDTLATDNATAFKNALNYLKTSEAKVKKLHIPTGDFMVDESILWDIQNVRIIGDGDSSRILPTKNVKKALFYSDHATRTSGTLQNVIFENFCLDGLKMDIYGILFGGFDRISSIRDMTVKRFGKSQIALNASWGFNIKDSTLNGFYEWNEEGGRTFYGEGLTMGVTELPIDSSVLTTNIPNITGNTFQFLNKGLNYYYGAGGNITGNNFENVTSYWLNLEVNKGVNVTGNYFEDLREGIFGVILGGKSESYSIEGLNFTGNTFMLRKDGKNDIQINNVLNSVIKSNRHHRLSDGTEPGNDIAFGTSSNLAKGNEIFYDSDEQTGIGNIDDRKNILIQSSSTAMSRLGGW